MKVFEIKKPGLETYMVCKEEQDGRFEKYGRQYTFKGLKSRLETEIIFYNGKVAWSFDTSSIKRDEMDKLTTLISHYQARLCYWPAKDSCHM